MTDEKFGKIIDSLPDGMNGFLKTWGLQQFAVEVEAALTKAGKSKWIDASVPPPTFKSHAWPVSVLGVVDDPHLRMNGDQPFVDIVAYWPALKQWTVTHQCAADPDSMDYPVRVTHWMPKPELPKGEQQ